MNALIGAVTGSILFLVFTVVAQPGKWMFVNYSEGTAIFLYFGVALLFVAAGVIGGLLIDHSNT